MTQGSVWRYGGIFCVAARAGGTTTFLITSTSILGAGGEVSVGLVRVISLVADVFLWTIRVPVTISGQ